MTFQQADLQGPLDYVGFANHGVAIQLQGQRQRYVFYPQTHAQLNQGKYFHLWAQRGDTIDKKAYADTLRLHKNGITYTYLFRQLDR